MGRLARNISMKRVRFVSKIQSFKNCQALSNICVKKFEGLQLIRFRVLKMVVLSEFVSSM